MTDPTLAGYLKALRTPAGAPTEGQVDWEKRDLLGTASQIRVNWNPTRLRISANGEEGAWSVEARRTEEGWTVVHASPEVKGGTILAKMRWAGKQIETVALGATPSTSWTVSRSPRNRRPGP